MARATLQSAFASCKLTREPSIQHGEAPHTQSAGRAGSYKSSDLVAKHPSPGPFIYREPTRIYFRGVRTKPMDGLYAESPPGYQSARATHSSSPPARATTLQSAFASCKTHSCPIRDSHHLANMFQSAFAENENSPPRWGGTPTWQAKLGCALALTPARHETELRSWRHVN